MAFNIDSRKSTRLSGPPPHPRGGNNVLAFVNMCSWHALTRIISRCTHVAVPDRTFLTYICPPRWGMVDCCVSCGLRYPFGLTLDLSIPCSTAAAAPKSSSPSEYLLHPLSVLTVQFEGPACLICSAATYLVVSSASLGCLTPSDSAFLCLDGDFQRSAMYALSQ